MLEVRVVTLEDMFSGNRTNLDKLSSIIEEETVWANEANETRDRYKKRQRQETIIKCVIFGVLGLISIWSFTILMKKNKKYSEILSKMKKIEPEEKMEYYREFPDEDATPAEAAFLYYFNKSSSFSCNITKIVSATILNLALKKAITFVEDAKDQIRIVITKQLDLTKLADDEKSIYEMLLKAEEYISRKSKDKKDGISMKEIEKYAKNNDVEFLEKVNKIEPKARKANEIKGNYKSEVMKEAIKWESRQTLYIALVLISIFMIVFIFPIILVIPSIACFSKCKKIAKVLKTLTQKGENEKEKWHALKRYMENFSLLNEREVPELVLWEKYLVYATAFGIADKVLSQLKVRYPQLADEQFLINNGYAYMYIMNRYTFDRMIGSSMQRAYNARHKRKAIKGNCIK